MQDLAGAHCELLKPSRPGEWFALCQKSPGKDARADSSLLFLEGGDLVGPVDPLHMLLCVLGSALWSAKLSRDSA